jgi:hypothetical protein
MLKNCHTKAQNSSLWLTDQRHRSRYDSVGAPYLALTWSAKRLIWALATTPSSGDQNGTRDSSSKAVGSIAMSATSLREVADYLRREPASIGSGTPVM